MESLHNKIENIDTIFFNNVLVDDRTNLTIGRRYLEAKKNGYPFILALGKTSLEVQPLFELTDVNNSKQLYLNENDLLTYLKNNCNSFGEQTENVQQRM